MSLRRRLLLTLGVALAVLWIAAAAWLLVELHYRVRHTLDQRLVASANMVAGLVGQVPSSVWRETVSAALSTPPTEGVACQIRSMRGQVLLETRGDVDAVLNHAPAGFTERSRNGHRWRVYTTVQNGLSITVADRLAERDRLQLGIVLAAVLPFVVALIGGLLVSWWAIRRGLAPLERLRGELAKRDPEALAPVTIERAPAELEPVIGTLNGLLLRTDEAMRREQRFTSNAAHELRTPLTAIKTHVQLARRGDARATREALENAEAGVVRLQRTLEQLLLLARVESDQPWPDTRPASVDETVRLAMADLRPAASFAVEGRLDDTLLALPGELAVTALRNLLDNALKHSGAPDSVRLRVETGPNTVVFEVSDEGSAVNTPASRRFERGRASGGSGLGLAIVSAITTRFGGRLDMARREPRGLCARLTLVKQNFPRMNTDEDE
jgi:signal transduction histidine kinase